MDYIMEGVREGVTLILTLDRELINIAVLSLSVSLTATVISSCFTVPLFVFIGMRRFKGEKILTRICNSLMSIPSILIGLIVALVLARRGPFGSLQLMYTKTAMIIAQTLLVTPLIAALTYDRTKSRGRKFEPLGKTLGGSRAQISALVISQLRNDILIIGVTAFSRAISEVGAVMMVGGNIKGKTRVMTTAIALSNSKGEYPLAIGLGIVLLFTALIINFAVHSSLAVE